MNSTEHVLSAIVLVRLFVIFLYGAAGIMAMRWLLPRLSVLAKRLAIGFFVAQVFVLGVGLTIESATGFERWLWDLDQERNVPATLAVRSWIIMELFPRSIRTNYGPGTAPSSHNDGGNPPSNTK